MVIRRAQPPIRGKLTWQKPFAILSLFLLTMSCVTSSQAEYRPIPGIRGSKLTILLDPPVPMDTRAPPSAAAQQAAFDPNAPQLDQAVPFPEIGDINQYGFSPTPSAVPSLTPLVLPTQFNTGPAAVPFTVAGKSSTDAMRAAICLTSAIYYEAASESDDGQRAVAQVILNRVKHPAWPNTVCGVIYQGSEGAVCQFSYACDGSMMRTPTREGWSRASRIARAALAGFVFAPVGLSTFYHADYVNPAWNRNMIITNRIGRHIFYRPPGAAGSPQTYYASYRGFEPYPGPKPKLYVPSAPANIPAYVPAPTPSRYIAGANIPAAPWQGAVTGVAASPSPQVSAAAPRGWKPSVREDDRYVQGALPDSDVLPQYRDSGQWIRR